MQEEKYTYCRVCEANCGLKATVVDGKITEVAGDPEHPVSKGYICLRGKATLDIHHDPDRVDYPLKKVNGEWERTGWKDAMSDIGSRLQEIKRKHGPHAVAIYFGNPLAFDFCAGMYLPMAMRSMGTRNIYSAGSQDCNNKFAASKRVYGSTLLHPIPDIEKIEHLIIFGSNPAVSHCSFISLPRPVERLGAITKRGGRVIFIDPRKTETVKSVGEHIFIRPDTDMFLLLAMIHVIVSEKLYDEDAVKKHTKGMEELEKLASGYPPEKAASVTGIPKEEIEKLARDFAKAKNAGIHGSLGINLGRFGTMCYWLIQSLNAITGKLDRRGSMIFCKGLVDPKMAQSQITEKKAVTSRIGGFRSVMRTMPAGILADEILTEGEGQIKALICISGNPILTAPDSEKLEKAFKSLDLLVSLDFFVSETGALGDYVLPCTDMYERYDLNITATSFSPIRLANFTHAVVEPKAERKHTWVVLHEILQAAKYSPLNKKALGVVSNAMDGLGRLLGAREPWSFRPKTLLRLMLRMGKEVSWKELMGSRQGVLLPDHVTGEFFRKNIMTVDKKMNLAPEDFIAEAGTLEKFFNDEQQYEGLKLIGQRQRRTHNSWFHNITSFMEKEVTNHISINPEDASLMELEDGETAFVQSELAGVEIPVKVTDDVMPGVVSIPHGWGHNKPSGLSTAKKFPGVNVNSIMPAGAENLEKFAGMAKLTGVRVSVRKA